MKKMTHTKRKETELLLLREFYQNLFYYWIRKAEVGTLEYFRGKIHMGSDTLSKIKNKGRMGFFTNLRLLNGITTHIFKSPHLNKEEKLELLTGFFCDILTHYTGYEVELKLKSIRPIDKEQLDSRRIKSLHPFIEEEE